MNASHRKGPQAKNSFLQVLLLVGLLILSTQGRSAETDAGSPSGETDADAEAQAEIEEVGSEVFGEGGLGAVRDPKELTERLEAITAENADALFADGAPGAKRLEELEDIATSSDDKTEVRDAVLEYRRLNARLTEVAPESSALDQVQTGFTSANSRLGELRSGSSTSSTTAAVAPSAPPAPVPAVAANTPSPSIASNGTGAGIAGGAREINPGGQNAGPGQPGAGEAAEGKEGQPEEGAGAGRAGAGAGGAGAGAGGEEVAQNGAGAGGGAGGGGAGSGGGESSEGGDGGGGEGGAQLITTEAPSAEDLGKTGSDEDGTGLLSGEVATAMVGQAGGPIGRFSYDVRDYQAIVSAYDFGSGTVGNVRRTNNGGGVAADLEAANAYTSASLGFRPTGRQRLLDLAEKNKERAYGVLGPANLAGGSSANRRFLAPSQGATGPRSIQEIYGSTYLNAGSAKGVVQGASQYGQGHKY